jgi:predicted ATPase
MQSCARIVITGGPSAGKTTLIEILKNQYGARVATAPEAATILFSGGFPRPRSNEDRLHTQRSIYALQRELELQGLERARPEAPLVCDRGSLDGAAYWAGSIKEFCLAMGTTLERELARYTAIIHLETAAAGQGYEQTMVRTESPTEAIALDTKVGNAWRVHPNYVFIPHESTFVEKVNAALARLAPFLPNRATEREDVPAAQAPCA